KAEQADAVVVMIEEATDWEKLKKKSGKNPLIVLAEKKEHVEGIESHDIAHVVLDMESAPVFEKLSQGLLEAVADEFLSPGANVIAVYSGFDPSQIDSISFIELTDHLGRLTARDLQNLETKVPLDTLKTVVDLAVEIGREGREGKPVGTMFVVGDHRRVLEESHPAGFDLSKGYSRKERSLMSARNREAVKEIAQLDGAFVVSQDGTVEGASRIIDTAPVQITMTTGLGSRHWAGAAISKNTNAIAVVVSESDGTVRIFQNGGVVLRVVPFRRAMKFKEFDFEPPSRVE
ncbi:MAG: DNA integrity scanning protein DisA nucleotide-binding domain protein, partial [Planctomycetota bacterium]|nr:DNA integrity scanning protein DisA nucleotide-binding domain protein [Planctomycetota bacterium]